MMTQQYRKKKTDDGRTVTYPLGTSKRAADGLARALQVMYPEENIKVIRLGKGKDMFAPFFAYVGERMARAFPLDKPEPGEIVQERNVQVREVPKESTWFSTLPRSTFQALAEQITDGSTVYSVINGASQDGKTLVKGDVTVFGATRDGSVSYVIEWPHMSDNPEPSVGIYSSSMEKSVTDPVEATALRTKVLSSVDNIRSMHRFSADLRDNDARRILDMLNAIQSPTEIVGVRYANDQLTVYPINHGNEMVSVNAESRNRHNGEARTFMHASSLKAMLDMFVNSGTPDMIMGIGTGDPIFGQLKLYPEDPHSYFGTDEATKKKPYREVGQMSIVAAPADGSETRAMDLVNYYVRSD